MGFLIITATPPLGIVLPQSLACGPPNRSVAMATSTVPLARRGTRRAVCFVWWVAGPHRRHQRFPPSKEGKPPPPANGTEVAGGAAPTPLTEPDMDQEVADTATHPSPQGPDSTGHKVPDVSYHGPVIKTPSRLSRLAVRGRDSAFTSFPFCCQYQGPGRAVGAPWATTVP